MIRVLRIINRFNLGGPIYNAAFLSAGIGQEFETKLIGGSHEESEGDARYIPLNVGVEPIVIEHMQRSVSIVNDKKALKEIRDIIRSFKPHIVHTHASKAGALGRKAAFAEKVPIVVHTFHGHVFHGYFGKIKTYLYKSVERQLARKTDCIIAISNEQKRQLTEIHKIAPPEKFQVVPLGFDLAPFKTDLTRKRIEMRKSNGIDEAQFTLGIIGRLVPIKNHDLLFDALENIAGSISKDVLVCIVGDGERRKELENKAKEIASENIKFKFLGWQKEVDKVLAGLDIVALTSLNEGTPVSLIEAQASGTPLITTNVGGVIDVVRHNETGLIVDSFDPRIFGESLLKLIEDEDLREKMTQNGWNFVEQRFSKERLCNDMQLLYKRLAQEKGIENDD